MRKIFFPGSTARFINKEANINELRTLAHGIAKKNKNVDNIYLFGSYARGDAGVRSDADILVILKKDDRRMMDRLDEFIAAFSDGPVPVDVLVWTKSEIDKALGEKNSFIKRALEGIPLI